MLNLKYFLIEFDRAKQDLVSIDEFVDGDEALQRYSERERSNGSDHEVVPLAAESIEELKATHSHYFGQEAMAHDRARSLLDAV